MNAGFRIKVDPTSLTVSGIPSFVFGGIAEHGVRLQYMHIRMYVRTYLLTVCAVHLNCVAEVLYNGLY